MKYNKPLVFGCVTGAPNRTATAADVVAAVRFGHRATVYAYLSLKLEGLVVIGPAILICLY